MLRITESSSPDAAKRYYTKALSTGEYYHGERVLDQESIGLWGGAGAERLGQSGVVAKDAFHRLCDNQHPATGDKLTVRNPAKRRPGYDFNFHPPKSVSLALELTGDRRIVAAFREAVAETMRELETEMATRVRRGGVNEQRTTGNLVWAEFVHHTSRPVDGVPDPHLHSHCFAFNATFDPIEQRWKAGEFGDLKRDAPYYQAAFHARLAEGMQRLGYGIEKRHSDLDNERFGWELAGISESLIHRFSRRTQEIERVAREQGVSDPAKKAELGAKTRKAKQTTTSMADLRRQWTARLSEKERDTLAMLRGNAVHLAATHHEGEQRLVLNRQRDLDAALRFATADLFLNSSVVSEKQLLAAALEHAVGRVTPECMQARLDKHVEAGEFLRKPWGNRVMVTTPEVLQEEQAMLAAVREGRGKHPALRLDHKVKDKQLTAEQRRAVKHVLEAVDSVIAVSGLAGAGKTRLMREVARALDDAGVTLQASAPRAQTTHEVLREDGFASARTVAHVLKNEKLQKRLTGQVLWVDEAGQLSMPDMQRLVSIAAENNIRLLLTGDTRQHRAVRRGDAFRLFEAESGLPIATLSEVRRQSVAMYREAAQALASGDLVAGFDTLDRMGAIKEVGNAERVEAVAEAYVAALTAKHSTLVVSPTHAEGKQVTASIREKLKEATLVAERETPVVRLLPKHMSDAKKQDATRYVSGDVVRFQQHAGNGFKAADRAEVVGVDKGVVTVERERDGQLAALPLAKADRFEVYKKSELRVAAGDRIRITRNGYTDHGAHRLNNGAVYGIKSIDDEGNMTLANGWKLRAGYGHIDYGYVATSDASQGTTVDEVLLAQSGASSGAASSQQFYTSITRGREVVAVFTDDKAALLKTIARDTSRLTATEFMKESMAPPQERGLENRRAIGRWLMQQERQARTSRDGHEHGRDQTRDRGRSDRGRDRGGIQRER